MGHEVAGRAQRGQVWGGTIIITGMKIGGSRAGAGRGLATLTMRLCSCRGLWSNQLTSLPSGIFDKLTALTYL